MTIPTRIPRLLFFCLLVLVSASSVAQETEPDEESNIGTRERIIVNVEHLEVGAIAKAVAQLSTADLRLFSDPDTNRLVIDGPKETMPGVVGLIRELDRPVPQIRVELTEVSIELGTKTKLESGPSDELARELDELVKDGKARIVNRLSVEVANNASVEARLGNQKPSVTGSDGRSKSYSFDEVGVIFQCKPRMVADAVLVSYGYEKSDTVPSGIDDEAPRTLTKLQTNSIIRIPTDQSVVAGGIRLGNDGESVLWKIILSAKVAATEDDDQ